MASQAQQTQKDIGELFGSFKIIQNLSYTVIGMLVAVATGGIALYREISETRHDLQLTKKDIGGFAERLKNVESSLKQLETQVSSSRSLQQDMLAILGRIESKLPALPPPDRSPQFLSFNASEAALIRDLLKPQIATWKSFTRSGFK